MVGHRSVRMGGDGLRGIFVDGSVSVRERLRLLDGCLGLLEKALESGEEVVSVSLAGRLSPIVKGLAPGIPITMGQEIVFREQGSWLGQQTGASSGEGRRLGRESHSPEKEATTSSRADLTEVEARRLTDRIKAGVQNLAELVFEAHTGRAWIALGYSSWEEYVKREFGLSRSRSYEFVDQGRVLRALSSAAKSSLGVEITPYAAREIKHHIPELVNEIRVRVGAGVSAKRAREIVNQVVEERRRAIAVEKRADQASRDTDRGFGRRAGVLSAENGRGDALIEVIRYLTSLPPPSRIIERVTTEGCYDKAQVRCALAWLTEFAEEIGALPAASARRAG